MDPLDVIPEAISTVVDRLYSRLRFRAVGSNTWTSRSPEFDGSWITTDPRTPLLAVQRWFAHWGPSDGFRFGSWQCITRQPFDEEVLLAPDRSLVPETTESSWSRLSRALLQPDGAAILSARFNPSREVLVTLDRSDYGLGELSDEVVKAPRAPACRLRLDRTRRLLECVQTSDAHDAYPAVGTTLNAAQFVDTAERLALPEGMLTAMTIEGQFRLDEASTPQALGELLWRECVEPLLEWV